MDPSAWVAQLACPEQAVVIGITVELARNKAVEVAVQLPDVKPPAEVVGQIHLFLVSETFDDPKVRQEAATKEQVEAGPATVSFQLKIHGYPIYDPAAEL